MAVPMANGPPFATLNHVAADLGIPNESEPLRVGIIDVVDFQPAGRAVAQQEIGFAGDAAEIADPGELPIHADRAHEGRAGDRIVGDVVDLDPAGVRVAQDHVGLAAARKVAEAHDLPIHADGAQEGDVGDVVVANVVDLEAAAQIVAQQHVGGVAPVEAAERDKRPIESDLAQEIAREDGIAADVINLVPTVRTIAQDHVGGGASRWRRVWHGGFQKVRVDKLKWCGTDDVKNRSWIMNAAGDYL